MKKLVQFIVLFALVIQPGLGLMPATAAQESQPLEQDGPPLPAEASADSLLPAEITPPENCGVPLNGPFGKDLEVFRGGDQGLSYGSSPIWEGYFTFN